MYLEVAKELVKEMEYPTGFTCFGVPIEQFEKEELIKLLRHENKERLKMFGCWHKGEK